MGADEAGRLAALRRYRILDTEPEQAFDDLVLLASQICRTPIALISLVDSDRQWFKSRLGVAVTETSRDVALCAHAIQQRDLFVVPDATQDARFRDNPLVQSEPHIRFYAGAPLITPDDHALGTICALDHVPRTLTPEQRAALAALGRQVVAQLELRKNLDALSVALQARDRAEDDQDRLVLELRSALDGVKKLSAFMPYCSACQINMVIPADPAAIADVTDGVMGVLRNKAWPEDKAIEVELALQEALANAIRHGCGGDRSKRIQCCVTNDESGEVVIVIRDPGTGFDLASVPSPLEGENIFKPSGRGIYLINELMDEVRFADEGREISMRKRPARADSPPVTTKAAPPAIE
jgi:anti-sigma regulatory factor (Ser/Thr protein kinase)